MGGILEVALDAPPVAVDPTFFDEAITNVVENAIKYAGADASLRISAQPLPPRWSG